MKTQESTCFRTNFSFRCYDPTAPDGAFPRTCCRFGHGRLKVLVVRNPYARASVGEGGGR